MVLRDALRQNTHLVELSAGGLPLPAAAAEILGEITAASPSLTALCAGDAATGDESIIAFAHGLARSRALQRLDLGCRAIGPPGAAALTRALTSGGLANGSTPPAALPAAAGFPSLHTLILSGRPLSSVSPAELVSKRLALDFALDFQSALMENSF